LLKEQEEEGSIEGELQLKKQHQEESKVKKARPRLSASTLSLITADPNVGILLSRRFRRRCEANSRKCRFRRSFFRWLL
jgi:hypothetical protein